MAAHIAAGLDTAPSERWEHGQDRAPDRIERAPHQVASGVQRLLEAESIGDAEVTSADRFYRDWVEGIEGVRDEAGHGTGDVHDAQLARVKAVAAHRFVAEALGVNMTLLLRAFLVDDLTCSAMHRRFHLDASDGRKRMATRMATLLEILTQLYGNVDRRPARADQRRRDALRAAAAGRAIA